MMNNLSVITNNSNYSSTFYTRQDVKYFPKGVGKSRFTVVSM